MDVFQFYKSLYDRELNRRKDLDAAVNLPITILTILVAANSYLISKEALIHQNHLIIISRIILVLLLLFFLVSIFYLIRSYNNLFKGFGYSNFGLTKEIRNFEINEISNYNTKVSSSEKLDFETIIIEKLTHYTDDHIAFNDKRSLDLHNAKTFIIVTLILTGLKSLLIAFNYLEL